MSVNCSEKVGTIKRPVREAELVAGAGLAGDAHSAPGPRAVSLMMVEDIEGSKQDVPARVLAELREAGIELGPGAYAENLTTAGLDLSAVKVGDELAIGDSIRLRISGIGKSCHHGCEIRQKLGDCIFPRKGVFAEVLSGGVVKAGDRIEKS